MAGLKIKTNDEVVVISGKDRGKQGRVIVARPAQGRVVVENLNIVKRHTRPRPIRQRSGIQTCGCGAVSACTNRSPRRTSCRHACARRPRA